MTANESEARRAIVNSYRELADAGLMQLSSGNISHRLGERMLITPTGAERTVQEDDIVLVDRSGREIGAGIPSSEWSMHLAIYANCPDAQAIVHTHGDYATALACQRKPLPAFHYMVASFGGDDVPCTDFAPFGSKRLGELAAAALGNRTACLMANHGTICRGATMAAATKTARKLEMMARQYVLSLSVGNPVLLKQSDMDETLRRYSFYGHSRIPEDGPAWSAG
ncbi:MAG: class II aldolase/adducin family protein [Rhizobiaceae bacterium]|nr:class II aldolase/adducin family protein [Rhizobiaceae bacterium]